MQSNLINLFNGIVKREINVFNDEVVVVNDDVDDEKKDIEMTDDITPSSLDNEDQSTPPQSQSQPQQNKLLFNKDSLLKEIQKIFLNIKDPVQIEIKTSIDLNIRIFFNNLIKQMDTTYENIDLAIKLAYSFVDLGILDSILPLQLSEDLFETKTISKCLDLFGLLESRAEIFSQDPEIIKGRKRNLLLKICIELLKRETNPDSCGRILLFLAYVFPLSDPSGLNIKGEHNVHPEEALDFQNDIMNNLNGNNNVNNNDDDTTTAAAAATTINGNNDTTVDRNFYRQFWGLQTVFQNSQQVLLNTTVTSGGTITNITLNKIKWESFIQSIELVIGSFSTHINLDELSQSSPNHPSKKHYFTKYLTSSNLMKLQLKDSIFRKNILTQILITFQALDLTHQKYPTIFNDLQKNIIQELTNKCLKILSNTNPNGEYFSNCLSSILKREKNWFIWKRDNQCKPFERPPCSPIVKKKKLFRKTALTKISLGNQELSRLWNLSGAPNDRSYLKTQNSVSLDSFIEPLKKETIEQEEKAKQEALKLERRKKNEQKRADTEKARRKEYDEKKAEFLLANPTKKDRDYQEYEELPAEVDSDDLSDLDEPKELLRDNPVYVWKTLRLISRKKLELFKNQKFDDIIQSFIKPSPSTTNNTSITTPPATTTTTSVTVPVANNTPTQLTPTSSNSAVPISTPPTIDNLLQNDKTEQTTANTPMEQ
ncbi:hypothetical protein RB653_002498 [Dictyostelium firmibasis]|uniref:THO complex subunit 1 n=1 Tax=Dictyostelium firmibasis TaxID=79012 RepID=A0AAN7TYF3_9MYCE